MSSNSERGFRAQVEARYKQTQALEKKALSLLKVKSPFDAEIRALRDTIRDNYENILLTDYDFATDNDVELNLWSLHYRRIMEFRQRINAASSTTASGGEASGHRTSQKGRPDKAAIQKLCAVFRSFLAEASGFYHNLIYKLRAKYGLPQDFSGFLKPEVSGSWSICQKSCHRCLIYLGDLARYKELHGDSEGRSQDWSVASGYYLQAAAVWPAGGNPHNQLAVLASYVNDELLSAYHYFRSLAVETPFLTARDNLIMQFEKNRQRFLQLTPLSSKTSIHARGVATKGERGLLMIGDGAMKLAVKGKSDGKPIRPDALMDYSSMQKSFSVRFVRLNGILFTKTSLETFTEVYSSTLEELEQLLRMEDEKLETQFGAQHNALGYGGGGASRFLHLVVMLIFTIENISWMPDNQQPSYAEILQRSLLYQHAFTAAFEVCGQLVLRCKASFSPKQCPVLPSLVVFLEWLSCHPGVVIGSDIGDQQANARGFFWQQMIGLLNSILEREGGWSGGLAEYNASGVLWEDHELRGFQPIAKIQAAMDFSQPATQTNMWGDAQSQMRLKRLIEAGITVASAAEEMGKSLTSGIGAMEWKDDLGRFTLPGVALDPPSLDEYQEAETIQSSEGFVQNGGDYEVVDHKHADVNEKLEQLKVAGETKSGSSINGSMKELVPVGAEWLAGMEDALNSWETPLEGDGALEAAGEMPDGPSDGDEEYEELEDGGATMLEVEEEEEVIVFKPVQNRQPTSGQQGTVSNVAVTVSNVAVSGYSVGTRATPSAAVQRDVLAPGPPQSFVQHDISSPWSAGILPGFSMPYPVGGHENMMSKPLPNASLTAVRPSGYSMAMGGVTSSGGWGEDEPVDSSGSQGQSRPLSLRAWLPGAGSSSSTALPDNADTVSAGVIGQSKRPVATAVPVNDNIQSKQPAAFSQTGPSFVGRGRTQVDIPVPKPLHPNQPTQPSSHPDYFAPTSASATGLPGANSTAPYSAGASLWAGGSAGQQRDSLGPGWNGGTLLGHKLNVNGLPEMNGLSKDGLELASYGGGNGVKNGSPDSLQQAWHSVQTRANLMSNLAAYGGNSTALASSRPTSIGVIGAPQQASNGGRPAGIPVPSQMWERNPQQMAPASGLLKDFAGSQDDYGWLDEFSQSKQLPGRGYQGQGQQLQQGNGSSLWSTPVRSERTGAGLPPFPGMVRGSHVEEAQGQSGFSEDRPQWRDGLSRDPFVS